MRHEKTEACSVASSPQENMCVTFSRWFAKNPMGRATRKKKKKCFPAGHFKKCLGLNEMIFLEQTVVVNKAARKIPDAFHENKVTCTMGPEEAATVIKILTEPSSADVWRWDLGVSPDQQYPVEILPSTWLVLKFPVAAFRKIKKTQVKLTLMTNFIWPNV